MRRTLVAEYVRRGVMFGSAPCGADVMMEGLIAGLRRVCTLVDGFLFEEKQTVEKVTREVLSPALNYRHIRCRDA